MPDRASRRSVAAPVALAAGVVVLAPPMVGAVHPWSLSIGAVLATAAALLVIWRARPPSRLPSMPWILLPVWMAYILAVASMIPVPAMGGGITNMGEMIAQATSKFADLPTPSIIHTISLDHAATGENVLRLWTGLQIAFVLAHTGYHRQQRKWIWRILAVGGALVFLIALGHRALGVDRVWGIWGYRDTPFSTPLVNPNHLARVFGAFALLLIGRSLSMRKYVDAYWYGGIGFLCSIGVFLTYSRGGSVAFMAALLLLIVMLLRRYPSLPKKLVLLPVVGTCITASFVAFLSLGLSSGLSSGLLSGSSAKIEHVSILHESKFALYQPALAAIEARPWGAGVGTFRFASSNHDHAELAHLTISHAENIILDTLLSYGIVPSVVMWLVLCWSLWHIFSKKSVSSSWYLYVPVILFLGFGDLVDFSLETGAGFWLLCLCLGGIAMGQQGWLWKTRVWIVVYTVGILLTGYSAYQAIVENLPAQEQICQERQKEQQKNPSNVSRQEQFLSQYQCWIDVLSDHPYDAQTAYRLAATAREMRRADVALAWSEIALTLAPSHQYAHLEAARALWGLRRLEQAMGEYRSAWHIAKNDAAQRKKIIREVFLITHDVNLRMMLAPVGDFIGLTSVCDHMQQENGEDTKKKQDVALCRYTAISWLHGQEPVHTVDPLCAKAMDAMRMADDPDGADRVYETCASLETAYPVYPAGEMAAATARMWQFSVSDDAALTKSQKWLAALLASNPSADAVVPILRWQMSLAIQQKAREMGLSILQNIQKFDADAVRKGTAERWHAELLDAVGEHGAAWQKWRALTERYPRDESFWRLRMRCEEKLKMYDAASSSAHMLQQLHPNDAEADATIKRAQAPQLPKSRAP